MKIVFLSYLHGFGGAERQNIMLANAMAELGHDVVVASISANNNCYELSPKIKYVYLPDRMSGIFRLVSRFQDIRKVLQAETPDITVNFWFQSAYFTALMKKSITGKVIYSERGDPGDQEYSGALGLVRRIVLPRIDGFAFQSTAAKHYFNEKVQKRSVVIPNPVFVNRSDFPEIHMRSKRIVSVGRLHEQKNMKLLIDSFSKIADCFPDYIVDIYGDGEQRTELEEYIERKNLVSRVFLRGATNKVHEKIYDASLFVLSSDYEGMPNALLEAMALGLPSISTNWSPGGVIDLIEDQVSGLIVQKANAAELSAAMKTMLSMPEYAEKCGKCALEKSTRFQADVIYEMWNDFFEKQLDS